MSDDDVPQVVKDAISGFSPDAESGLTLIVPPPSTTADAQKKGKPKSVIDNYGVRVSFKNSAKEGRTELGWVCLYSPECRNTWTVHTLYGGKTSNATQHLREVHSISADVVVLKEGNKRSREEEVEDLRNSQMYKTDPKRLRLLLETRAIVLNNRPFCSGDSRDDKIKNDLFVSEKFQTNVHYKAVTKTVIEMYSATKREVVALLEQRQPGVPSLTLSPDFWECKVQGDKYLGIRVYMIDNDWNFRSIMLGVRGFDPSCEVRVKGFRGVFKSWTDCMLSDFGINTKELFGGMSDGASDVKGLLVDEYKLSWEWCIPHLTNAATKWACGMTDNAKDSRNPDLTKLIEQMRSTIRQVRDVTQFGDLFEALCVLERSKNKANPRAAEPQAAPNATQLVDYRSHRFLGLKLVIERILDKWKPLLAYYSFGATRPKSAKAPNTFVLAKRHDDLVQLLSLLTPITTLNKMSQADQPLQVKTLLLLYHVRQVTLDLRAPLRHYQSIPKIYIPVEDLTPLAKTTRELLAKALDARFFSGYTDPGARTKHRYVFECQLFLHPKYKDLDNNLVEIVQFCVQSQTNDPFRGVRAANNVKTLVVDRVKALMKRVRDDPVADMLSEVDEAFQAQTQGEMSEELALEYGGTQVTVDHSEVMESQVEEELLRWSNHPSTDCDSILKYWKGQSTNFRLLSRVAKIVFAFPTSSAQVERDFGDCGRMVTKDRANLKSSNVEMASFLRANKEFTQLTQCEKIDKKELVDHIPRHMLKADEEDNNFLPAIFSRISCEETKEE
ncbi:hypothetical protein ATCC90586_001527 [Pythium insidiosum]|nr:hypothetical protein ATCC90586_001527 [Pythium insidiosum]